MDKCGQMLLEGIFAIPFHIMNYAK